jgi:hypothetical protein
VHGYWVAEDLFTKELAELRVGDGIGDGEVLYNDSPEEGVAVPEVEAKPADGERRPLGIPAVVD